LFQILCVRVLVLNFWAGNSACQRRTTSDDLLLPSHKDLDAMTSVPAIAQPKAPAPFRKQVMTLLGENYGDKTLVLCPTLFVKLLDGDHKAAILLSQILYWSDRTKDPDGWFYKSYADWHAETGLSEAQVRRIVNGDPRVAQRQLPLRDLGVETLLRKVKRTGAPTLHYRVNQAQFLAALARVLGQGDSPQCAGSILNIGGGEPLALAGMNTQQSAASLIPAQITHQEISAEDQPSSNPTHHPDDDGDVSIFTTFENRFGKLKSQTLPALQAEAARLGTAAVREVLTRCAARGRSWNYVLKALANETGSALVSHQAPISVAQNAGAGDLYGELPEAPVVASEIDGKPAEAPLVAAERVRLRWGEASAATVQEVWDSAYQQMAFQFDRASFASWLQGAALVDYDPATATLTLVVRTRFAQDMLRGRLDRTLRRIIRDVSGQAVALVYLLREEWEGQGGAVEQIA
jgi:hypothetical protein